MQKIDYVIEGAMLLVVWATASLILHTCDAQAKQRVVFDGPEPSIEELVYLIRENIPQAKGEGFQASTLQPKYYTEGQLRSIATGILEESQEHDLPALWLLANAEVQSHFRFDAVSPTNDYGMFQLHCPKRGVCHGRPLKAEKALLFDTRYSTAKFADWAVYFRDYCGKAMTKRCRKNLELTGILSWIGEASLYATHLTIKRYQFLLLDFRAMKRRVI